MIHPFYFVKKAVILFIPNRPYIHIKKNILWLNNQMEILKNSWKIEPNFIKWYFKRRNRARNQSYRRPLWCSYVVSDIPNPITIPLYLHLGLHLQLGPPLAQVPCYWDPLLLPRCPVLLTPTLLGPPSPAPIPCTPSLLPVSMVVPHLEKVGAIAQEVRSHRS